MKNYRYLSIAALIALSSCGASKQSAQSASTDSTTLEAKNDSNTTALVVKMNMPETVKVGDSVLLKFTVVNVSDTSSRFCKWHSPFEPLMSKYLDVKNEKGEEPAYLGAMAKRMMPPPESSYLTVSPKDSVVATVDLLKAYAIKEPGKYTITYVGENMSGLKVSKDVTFNYVK
jgi:hypothetical protein